MMELAINALVSSGIAKEKIIWIGFDDERLASLTSDDLDLLLQAYMEMYPDIPLKDVYFFFDELPLIKGWELFVLRVFKSYCKHIYVCGSNAHVLSKEMKSELRGWPHEQEIWPLSFHEYCNFLDLSTNIYLESNQAKLRLAFDDFNRFGGMPEIVLKEKTVDKFRKLQGYFDTMLLRDFIEHWKISNPLMLRYFIKRVMSGIANPVSVHAIYNDIRSQGLKCTQEDLYDWLDKACGIYLFLRVTKFSRSIIKEHQALAKYYVIDNGLRTANLIAQTDDAGKQLENTVFLHLFRTKGAQEKICYYQEKYGCDFVVCNDNEVQQLIQVTWDMEDSETREREINGILAASKALGCNQLTIVTHDEENEIQMNGKTIHLFPAWKFCLATGNPVHGSL